MKRGGMTVLNNILKAAVVVVVLFVTAVDSHEDVNAVSKLINHGVDVSITYLFYLLMFHMTLPHKQNLYMNRTISRQYIQLMSRQSILNNYSKVKTILKHQMKKKRLNHHEQYYFHGLLKY